MVIEKPEQGVPDLEHPESNFDWNDIRLFVLVARCGSFRRASTKSNVSINSIRRRLQNLEYCMGQKLLIRDAAGSHVTEEGHNLLMAGQRMIEASQDVSSLISRRQKGLLGNVRIGVTEGLGTFWLVPRLTDFQQTHPHLSVDLDCTVEPPDVYAMHADLAVQFEAPEHNALIVTKLGYLHLQLFASPGFIRRNGMPKSLEDLRGLKFVQQISPQAQSTGCGGLLPDISEDMVSVRTNNSSTHVHAISQGAGLGILPNYARAISKQLVPVLGQVHFSREIYLTYKRDIGEQKHTRAAINWLKSAFDPIRYPWFSEKFISSHEFEDASKNRNIVNLFDGQNYA